MATGSKLPNTNLNLIQDIDMIDYADINAIAQAVEASSANINAFRNSKIIPNNTSLGAVAPGLWFASGGSTYLGMPPAQSWGHLLSWGTSANMCTQIFFGNSKVYWRHWINTNQSWIGWYEISGGSLIKSTYTMASNQNYSEVRQISVVKKNGWVTVDFRIRCDNPSDPSVLVYSGLPKPDSALYISVPSVGANRLSLGAELAVSGNLVVRYGETNTSYYGNFTYAIADS